MPKVGRLPLSLAACLVLFHATAALGLVVTVDTIVDSAALTACDDDVPDDCSLRGALVAAATAMERHDIRLPSGTYTLTASTSCQFQSAFGGPPFSFSTTSLCVRGDVAIIGSGPDTTILDGNLTDRTLVVSATATAAISGVTVTRGSQTGGSFEGGGGGILNHGTLTLADVVVTANTTAISGGGMSNKGTATVVASQFTANAASQNGGAIDNGHTGAGSARSEGTLTVLDSTLHANNAGSLGGAIFNVGSAATIVGSTLSGNTGGAIFNQGYGICDITGCFTGIGVINLTNSTITGNTGGVAAAIDSGRSSPEGASAVHLRNATITGNTGTPSCGGVLSTQGNVFTLENTILAGNLPAAVQCCPFGNATLVSGGYNLLGDASNQGCAVTGDTTGNQTAVADPLLGVLAGNGGLTETRAPIAASPVVDEGSPATPGSGGAACAAADQRGVFRPQGAACDVGAVERATTLALTQILPARGPANGSVIVVMSGAAFAPGASVVLRRTGSADIPGTPITIDVGGSALSTAFDLAGAALGAWDVVVTNPDTAAATLPGAFTVETTRAPDLWATLVTRRQVGAGQPARITIVFGNRGNTDAFGVPLTFAFPAPFSTRYVFEIANPPSQPGQVFNDYLDVPVTVATDDPTQSANVPLLLPVVPAGFTGTLDFLVTPPPQIPEGTSFLLSALLGTPFFIGDAPDPEAVASMIDGAKRYAEDHLETTISDLLDGTLADYASNQLTLAAEAGVASVVADLGHVRSVYSLAHLAIDLAAYAASQATAAAPPAPPPTVLGALGRRLAEIVGLGVATVEACPPCICGLAPVLQPGCGGCKDKECIPPLEDDTPPAKPKRGLTPAECRDIGKHTVSADGSVCKPDGSFPCPNKVGSPFSTDPFCRRYPISIDPNDKTGSGGAGEERFIPAGTVLPYSIAFENLPAAPAAAQTVTITDQLDTATLDLDTFSFSTVTVADASYTPPPGLTAFTGSLDLRPKLDIIVKIDATLAKPSGLVTWQFTSLDPATLDAVTNPDAGFLPPNTNPPQGDGSVQFFVTAKPDLATGTAIENLASIVFDFNEPIVTPTWLNTIDVSAPASQVDAVTPADCTATDLTVSWSGSDAGGGIAGYTVYVSENGGAPTPLVVDTADTSAPFTAELGKTYAFYSVARDVVGNVEAVPPTPDVVRAVADCSTNDFAITKIGAPKKVGLTAKKPAKTVLVKVKVQNRSTHPETITDAGVYAQLVRLTVDSLGVCPDPTATLSPAKLPKAKKFPLTLKSKASLTFTFDVPIDCASDPAKGAGHEDYSLSARVDHTPLGSGDAHPADDVCPRSVPPGGVVDAFPNGKIVDKGCGTKKPDKTLGAPQLIDVEQK